ncbi:alpha/beta hydrolase [Kutzneria sp. CA-103260]|uniref:alpha/beta hydrolase n=1 Tax=Kutzneria sp. CA-103260 TaxID=2802641 RepID=UPI001BA68F68|nr:alpha/beta hydrolase fold domain-containing protein [Kutzneria sp. CA-103260]QUQ68788.1 Acetyl esterase [Kutzneria sp. CA-103260]
MAIRVRPRQAATISPQAVAFLQRTPSSWIPSPLISAMTSAGMAVRFRKQFQAHEDVVEERLIAERGLTVERGEVAGVPVQWITPLAPAFADAVLLNIHGGGFIMGTARERTALLTASELNIRVCSVDYTLAPEAKARGIPMPAALGLFTPAADISGEGDSDASYPPTIITTCTRDTLASNGIRLYWTLRAAGVPVELRVGEGMWHGFNWEPDLPEAVTVRRDVTDFLARHLVGR